MQQGETGPSLSLGQERSWFIDQYVEAPVEVLVEQVRLGGPLRAATLAAALGDVVAAEAVLGLAIGTEQGRADRRPAAPMPAALAGADLSPLPASEREEAIRRAVGRAAETRFDLGRGPLIRAELLRLTADEHLLLLIAHRAVADPASLSLLVARLGAAYQARLADPSGPADPGVRDGFAAFAQQERATAEAARVVAGAAWREYLADVAPLELPTDRIRPVQPQYAAGTADLRLPPTLHEQVDGLAARLRVRPSDVLRAGFQALLHRWSGQPVLALGVSDERRAPETADLVGPVATWRVLRCEIDDRTPFAALCARPDTPEPLPFETLVEEVRPPRDPARSPVFQAAFTARQATAAADCFGEVTVRAQTLAPAAATLPDLALLTQPDPSGTRLTLTWRTDLFDPTTTERMLGHYVNLLRAAVADPDTAVDRLAILDHAERTRLLDEFNRTDAPFPQDVTVHELFEEQVLRTPDARAVTIEGRHLTYRELNEQANRLAHRLRAGGVGRGTLVALCLERSLELMVAVVAVLKSGGAYVPLDPAYPTDRLAFMLADTQARFLVTQQRLRELAPVGEEVAVLVLDEPADAASLAAQPAENPVNVNTADDLTYIVYTSGSTGRPKGVETIHRGVVRLVINTDILQLDERTSYLQISPLSFDACTLEIFGPLLNGGRVVLLPPGVPTPARVARTVREQGVDTLWLVAPLANLTIDTHLEDLRDLRQFMAGGDVLSLPHIRQVLERLPHVSMVNGYGPTEVTAFSVSHRITYVDPDWPSIPIGRPMHNTTAYILDPLGQPVPIGVWGELYLGGPGVALGYHNRPDLNAERFLPDTFRPGDGHRLYRTGDRCRWLPDGTVQFHGRLDTQVKIDGLRVELGEIQSAVADDESVAAAVVTAPVIGTRRTLVAYVVPADGHTFDPAAVRARVAAALPSVMVPAHYVTIPTIPLTPNNKVDFRALPAPELGAGGAHRPPETGTQQTVAEIWQEILGVPSVGLDDNFFELGGHSLRAVPMIAAVSMRFGVDLAVQDIFEAPVLEALATRIEERMLEAIPAEELERMFADIGG
ncbi:amino acid adenylation domain-containing protein [Micromonospora sp. NPDC049374]|uniref:non-ribosomal peptide synthetase n=1 Tax=Micromonospora sp. NPDC049374 TaxID=3154352 RepID=UPI003439DCA1